MISFSYGQQISYDDQQYKIKVNYDFMLLGGDKEISYFFEYASPNFDQKVNNYIVRYAPEEVKDYERFKINFGDKWDVHKVMDGGYTNGRLWLLFRGRNKDTKDYGLFGVFLNEDFAIESAKKILEVDKKKYVKNIQVQLSENKKAIMAHSGDHFVVAGDHFDIFYHDQYEMAQVFDKQLLDDGTLAFFNYQKEKVHLVRYNVNGENESILLNLDEDETCDLGLAIDAEKDELLVTVLKGDTDAKLHEILVNYENQVSVNAIDLLTYHLQTCEEKNVRSINFSEEVLDEVGIAGKFVKWLAFEDMIIDKDFKVIVLQKQYFKNIAINRSEREKMKFAEDMIFINMDDVSGKVKMSAKERQIWKNDDESAFLLKPLISIEGEHVYYFYYNIKTGAGTYNYELYFGQFDEQFNFGDPKRKGMSSKNLFLELTEMIPLGEKEYQVFGYHKKNMKLGRAIIRF